MLRTLLCRQNFLAGIAIFSMFFGAGNVVFPLLLGLHSKSQFPPALLGLIITSIGFPLLGVIGSSLFQGRALPFFMKTGKPVGLFINNAVKPRPLGRGCKADLLLWRSLALDISLYDF